MNILVSECLLGINCTYKASNNKNDKVLELLSKYNLIPICPEQLGGMTTPRPPSEVYINGKVINVNGENVTQNYVLGANISLQLAKMYNIKYAILKSKSPSCGNGKIYDGTFSKTLINGNGKTAQILIDNGIKVFDENNIDLLIQELNQLDLNEKQ